MATKLALFGVLLLLCGWVSGKTILITTVRYKYEEYLATHEARLYISDVSVVKLHQVAQERPLELGQDEKWDDWALNATITAPVQDTLPTYFEGVRIFYYLSADRLEVVEEHVTMQVTSDDSSSATPVLSSSSDKEEENYDNPHKCGCGRGDHNRRHHNNNNNNRWGGHANGERPEHHHHHFDQEESQEEGPNDRPSEGDNITPPSDQNHPNGDRPHHRPCHGSHRPHRPHNDEGQEGSQAEGRHHGGWRHGQGEGEGRHHGGCRHGQGEGRHHGHEQEDSKEIQEGSEEPHHRCGCHHRGGWRHGQEGSEDRHHHGGHRPNHDGEGDDRHHGGWRHHGQEGEENKEGSEAPHHRCGNHHGHHDQEGDKHHHHHDGDRPHHGDQEEGRHHDGDDLTGDDATSEDKHAQKSAHKVPEGSFIFILVCLWILIMTAIWTSCCKKQQQDEYQLVPASPMDNTPISVSVAADTEVMEDDINDIRGNNDDGLTYDYFHNDSYHQQPVYSTVFSIPSTMPPPIIQRSYVSAIPQQNPAIYTVFYQPPKESE